MQNFKIYQITISVRRSSICLKYYQHTVQVSVLIAATGSTLLYIPIQASAQITPSTSALDSTGNELGFMSQNTTDPAQNSTVANITQLATILPPVDPVTPATFVPTVSEESDEGTSTNDDDDDDDDSNDDNSNSDDGSSDDDDDDDSDDDDDDSGGDNGGVSVSAGGAFVSVG
jgi:hypothetical protein